MVFGHLENCVARNRVSNTTPVFTSSKTWEESSYVLLQNIHIASYKVDYNIHTACKHAHEVLKIPNIDYRHTVFDKKCLCFQRAQERAKSRVQYI